MVKKQLNIPMCLAFVLLCLTLISMHFTSGLYAKYVSKGTGMDSARVAKFDVNDSMLVHGESVLLSKGFGTSIRPGTDSGVSFVIDNNSEVTVQCFITVTNKYKNLPLLFSLGTDSPVEETLEDSVILESNTTGTYQLNIGWNCSTEEAVEYIKKVDLVVITVRIEQVD